ncbi:VOC family protein [Natronomonas salsuginis]|jgi:lactoylglutathione lyase|uniref:Glyoxalase n=1 Tax=Natronomonas salsuginis TaxID=2217661 RepID=A0A4U5JA43_9EURY|nr:VOC family protein [Natronomonas salsuginis]TKR26002.1 glyoxalase [Natronomonas salsuginis]
MTGELDHTMIRVADIDASIDWYETHLDYELKDRHDGDGFIIVYMGPEDMGDAEAMVELTSNKGQEEIEIGDAWGHIAVRVRDLEAAYDELMAGGVDDYRDPESCGGRYAFVKDPDGHEIELVERDHGSPWSLDHTMIRVEDADEALGYWVRKFDYVETRRWEADTFANYFVDPEDAPDEAMSVELTYNYDGRTYTEADGWGHLCIRLDDLHDDWEQLMIREAEDYRDPESCDDMYAFTKDQDGHEIELIVRDPDAESLFPF